MSGQRRGFGLVELTVALTILTIALLGLAGAAAVAHRAFLGAEAANRAADAAAMVLDSLVREAAPVSGERRDDGAVIRWEVRDDSVATSIALTVETGNGARRRPLSFHTTHHVR